MLDSPVVRIQDIRTKKVIELPLIQDENHLPYKENGDEVVRSKDDHYKDPNNNIVVVNKLILEQQLVVSVLITDTVYDIVLLVCKN
ncbi:MAG: hypothetical protein PUP92_33575 [Rhizonema sp. PD38]|nr:hypothetical protein [Rhizonema sp. PD38]